MRLSQPESRVVIFSAASKRPPRRIIQEFQADGYIDYSEKGAVTEEEKALRGVSVEMANGIRYEAGCLTVEGSIVEGQLKKAAADRGVAEAGVEAVRGSFKEGD